MTCTPTKIGDTVAIVCSRGPKPKRKPCSVCGRPSTKLCDWVLYPLPRSEDRKKITCDKPLCDVCAKHVDEDVDYCPDHPYVLAAAAKPNATGRPATVEDLKADIRLYLKDRGNEFNLIGAVASRNGVSHRLIQSLYDDVKREGDLK